MQAEAGSVQTGAPGREERQWAMLCHLSAMLMYCTAVGGFIAPLIIWLLKRDEMPFVADQGRETLNFQITTLIALMISGLLMLVLIGFVLFFAVLACHFVLTIVATVKSSEGVPYRYPFCWRLIR
ncbi:MAG: DUF4870 domain-containing protein [Proteobacteria bacterium]|nr:DUF4870 domain-containing protein [Pseudomonadota bacterium]